MGLKERYEALGVSKLKPEEDVCNAIERLLAITLPPEFIEISKFYPGGDLGVFMQARITSNADMPLGIVSETRAFKMRERLDYPYVCLGSDDGTFFLLNCDQSSPQYGSVGRVEYVKTDSLATSPMWLDHWSNYRSFFEEMLNAEEAKSAD